MHCRYHIQRLPTARPDLKVTDMTIRAQLIEAAREASLVAEQSQRVQNRKQGFYGTVTALAATTGVEEFRAAAEGVENDIRHNVDGLAKTVRAKPAKKEGQFTVPSSLSTAKSVLLAAYEWGTDLLEDDGETPRAFQQIKADNKAAKDAHDKANQSEACDIRDALAAKLAAMIDDINAVEPDDAMADHMAALSMELDQWVSEHAELSGEEQEQEQADAA